MTAPPAGAPPAPPPEEEEHTFHAPGWPGGEPEQIRQAADHWDGVADAIQAMVDTLRFNVDAYGASWSGDAKDSFVTEWTGLATGIDKAIPELRTMATNMRTAADDIEHAREEYKRVLVEIGVSIALGVAFSFVTFGGSGAAAGAMATANLARAALLAKDAALAARAAMLVASGLARTLAVEFTINFATDMGAQIAANTVVDGPGDAFDDLNYRNALLAAGISAGQVARLSSAGQFISAAALATLAGAGQAAKGVAARPLIMSGIDPVSILFAATSGMSAGMRNSSSTAKNVVEVGGSSDEARIPPAPTPPPHDSGSAPWGSQPLYSRGDDVAFVEVVKAAATAADARGYTNAARHLRHYLNNTGAPLSVNPDLIARDNPEYRTSVYEQLHQEVEHLISEARTNGRYGQPLQFQSGWKGPYLTGDWFLALGGVQHAVTGYVIVHEGIPPQAEVHYREHVYDRYNWDGQKETAIGPVTISDRRMGGLQTAGLAKEYDIIGSSTERTETVVLDSTAAWAESPLVAEERTDQRLDVRRDQQSGPSRISAEGSPR